MISLGGLELSPNLQVPEWPFAVKRGGSERTTFGGVLVVQRLASTVPRSLTLTAEYEGNRLYGYFTRAQLEHIRTMAESGEEVSFNYNGEAVQVVVPLSGISVTPLTRRTDPPASHPYYGTIQLLEV